MTTHRDVVLNALAEHRCSAILRTSEPAAVRPALDAAVGGGFRILEVTMTTPDALEHIAALRARDDLVVGAGTVLTPADADAAAAAGAQFLVSPVTDPAVIDACRRHGLASIPGTATPTEMMAAHRAGADLVKLFPGPAIGAPYVQALLGPMPFLKVFPTHGVDEQNCLQWLQAGSFGVGFVGSLFAPEDLARGRFDLIEARARRMTEKVQRRSGSGGSAAAAT